MGSQFYLHSPRSSANGMNHTCLCLPNRSWSSFTDPGGIKAELALGRWLQIDRPIISETSLSRQSIALVDPLSDN